MTILPLARLGALILCLALPASAQIVSGDLRNYDRRAPIDLSADRIEVLEDQNQALLTGNVEVSQGSLDLSAATIRVSYEDAGSLSVTTLVADGGVNVRTPAESARAARAIYDVPRAIVTLIGNVRLTRGTDTLTGERMVIDLDSGRSSIASTGENGRVTGRFTPSTDD